MKKLSRILAVTAALLMIISSVSSVFADMDDRDDYGYTVKIYAGKEGKFVNPSIGTVSDNGRTITIKAKAGQEITITPSNTGLTLNKGSEYYVRGFREAGHDAGLEKGEVSNPNFAVDEDRSYQAAYGLKGGMVSYTVQYLDASGNTLRESDVYYGMAGDKPVVSYKYIEGYQPNAYNLKKTLSEDESQNVIPFTYSKSASSQTTTQTADNDNNGTNGNNNNGNNANNANGNRNNGQTGAANADGTNLAGADGNANGDGSSPAEVVDLDDNSTPLADSPDSGEDADIEDGDTPKAGVSPVAIGAGVVVAAALAAAGVVLARRRREADDDDDEDDSSESSEE